MDIDGVGRRVAYWRNRRGLTQVDFGAMLGRSRRWVQDLEGGQRQSDPRLSVLEATAAALQIPLEALLSDADSGPAGAAPAECLDVVEVGAIREAMQRIDVITGAFDGEREPVALPVVRQSVTYAWNAFQAGHYTALGRLLPALIVDARHAAALADADASEAHALVSMTYQLTAETLLKFADADLSARAAERGVLAAEQSGHAAVKGAAARRLAGAMVKQGQAAAGITMMVTVADRMGDELERGNEAGLSALGMLFLKAAVAAAESGANEDTLRFLDQADEVAARLGRDANAMWSAFGQTNVSNHRVSTLVRLGEGRAAVAAANRIAPGAFAGLPRERRAHLLVDVAAAHAQNGSRAAAVASLLDAEQLAAQEVRCRPSTCNLVGDLLRLGAAPPTWELRGLAERCGVSA